MGGIIQIIDMQCGFYDRYVLVFLVIFEMIFLSDIEFNFLLKSWD